VTLVEGRFASAFFATSIAQVLSRSEGARAIAVDMPIGGEPDRFRRVDLEARRLLGRRWPSIFEVPPLRVLRQERFEEAAALCRRLTGKALSQQCFALRERILETTAAADQDPRLLEAHPELSFYALNGDRPAAAAKKSWNGLQQRRTLLAGAGLHVPDDLGEAGERAHADDVLDAAAVAWTAARYVRGEAIALPPEFVGASGRRLTIWR